MIHTSEKFPEAFRWSFGLLATLFTVTVIYGETPHAELLGFGGSQLDLNVVSSFATLCFGENGYTFDTLVISQPEGYYKTLTDSVLLVIVDDSARPLLPIPQRIPIPRTANEPEIDSIVLYVYYPVDRSEMEFLWLSAAPQYKAGADGIFVIYSGDSVRNHPIHDLHMRLFPEGYRAVRGGILSVDSLRWIDRTNRQPQILMLTMTSHTIGAGSPHSSRGMAFWKYSHGEFRFLGELPPQYAGRGGWGRVSSTGAEITVRDGARNHTPIIEYKRTYDYGMAWRSYCDDPGTIAFEFDSTRLLPVSMGFDKGRTIPVRSQLPMLVFEPWSYRRAFDTSKAGNGSIEICNSSAIEQQRSPIFSQIWWDSLRYVSSLRHWTRSDSCGTLNYQFDGDSLIIDVTVKDTERQLLKAQEKPHKPRPVALWIDTDILGDFDDTEASGDDKLAVIQASSYDSTATVDWYTLRKSSDGSMQRVFQRATGANLFMTTGAYRYVCHLSRSDIGLTENDGIPAYCGFAVEILHRGPVDETRMPDGLSYSVSGFQRYDPTTWGSFMEGIRRDTVYTR